MTDTALSINRPHGNRHPVDELALVRQDLKALQDRESDLKTIVSTQMGSADTLGGDEFIAIQKVTGRKGSLDEARMTADGVDVEKYRKPSVPVYSIRTEARVREDA